MEVGDRYRYGELSETFRKVDCEVSDASEALLCNLPKGLRSR